MDIKVTFYDLEARFQRRKNLFDSLDVLGDAAAKTRAARREIELERAINKDADAKAKEYLATKDGKTRMRFEKQVQLGRQVYESWSDGNKFQAALAPWFHTEDEESSTMTASLYLHVAPKPQIESARESAYTVILNELREECRKDCEEKLEEKRLQQEQGFAKMMQDFITKYGTAETKWEELWDEGSQTSCWYHWEKGTTEWQRPAICHKCDEIIDPMDVRCFNCNTDRHPGNVKLYQGISTLLESGEVDDDATYASYARHDSDNESDEDG